MEIVIGRKTIQIDRTTLALIKGRTAMYVTAKNYIWICFKGRRVTLHRLIMGDPKGSQVDHIDGDKLDCRRKNLRLATHAQNLWNRGKASHNKSGYKGVYLCKQTKRWRAEIRHNNVRVKLGRFESKIAAARAYDAHALKLHGAFARPNL